MSGGETTVTTGEEMLTPAITAAQAFVGFEDRINEILEAIGVDETENEGEEKDFEFRVAEALKAILSAGEGNEEAANLAKSLFDLIWLDTEQRLFGAEEGESSLLQQQIQKVLPAVIDDLINQAGEENNPLRSMRMNIDKLTHDLHILGDKMIPSLQADLNALADRIAVIEKNNKFTEGRRTNTNTGSAQMGS